MNTAELLSLWCLIDELVSIIRIWTATFLFIDTRYTTHKMNIAASDSIVGEYLIYRGFTQSYKSFESDRRRDKTQRFEVSCIVESIFNYLNGYEILNFVSLWDFMNKRFFVHLDLDHQQVASDIKSDLLKYYMVNSVKTKEKEKVVEFFQMYSHEILTESGIRSLRGWYILPYVDHPADDGDFSIYFTQKWIDDLRLSLGNFLSTVLASSPPPKLLLLERWYRAEAQQEIRQQLKHSFEKVTLLVDRLEKNEERIAYLHEVIKELSSHLTKAMTGGLSRQKVGLFETDETAEGKRIQVKEIGQIVCKLSQECSSKSSQVISLKGDEKLREILGHKVSNDYFGVLVDPTAQTPTVTSTSIEDVEAEMIEKMKQWMKILA
jgi:hypothetical protein